MEVPGEDKVGGSNAQDVARAILHVRNKRKLLGRRGAGERKIARQPRV